MKGVPALSKNTVKAGVAAYEAVQETLEDDAVTKALGSVKAKMAASGMMCIVTVSRAPLTLAQIQSLS